MTKKQSETTESLSRSELKKKFAAGSRPTQQDFEDLIDSVLVFDGDQVEVSQNQGNTQMSLEAMAEGGNATLELMSPSKNEEGTGVGLTYDAQDQQLQINSVEGGTQTNSLMILDLGASGGKKITKPEKGTLYVNAIQSTDLTVDQANISGGSIKGAQINTDYIAAYTNAAKAAISAKSKNTKSSTIYAYNQKGDKYSGIAIHAANNSDQHSAILAYNMGTRHALHAQSTSNDHATLFAWNLGTSHAIYAQSSGYAVFAKGKLKVTDTLVAKDVDIQGGTITGTAISKPTISGGTMTGTAISKPTISGGTMTEATISKPTISGGTMTEATISKPTISGGTMTGTQINTDCIAAQTDANKTAISATSNNTQSPTIYAYNQKGDNFSGRAIYAKNNSDNHSTIKAKNKGKHYAIHAKSSGYAVYAEGKLKVTDTLVASNVDITGGSISGINSFLIGNKTSNNSVMQVQNDKNLGSAIYATNNSDNKKEAAIYARNSGKGHSIYATIQGKSDNKPISAAISAVNTGLGHAIYARTENKFKPAIHAENMSEGEAIYTVSNGSDRASIFATNSTQGGLALKTSGSIAHKNLGKVHGGSQLFIDIFYGHVGTHSSSRRYKTNIRTMGQASHKIYQLNPVIFNYKKEDPPSDQFGLVAEEVESIFPDLVIHNSEGQPETVRYDQLTPLLLNELIQKNKEILALQTQMKEHETLLQTLQAQLNLKLASEG